MSQKDGEELAYWICGVVAVLVGVRVWSTRVKPWLTEHVEVLREEGEVALGPVSLATSDMVAAGVIAAILLIVVATLRSSMKSRKKAKARAGASS